MTNTSKIAFVSFQPDSHEEPDKWVKQLNEIFSQVLRYLGCGVDHVDLLHDFSPRQDEYALLMVVLTNEVLKDTSLTNQLQAIHQQVAPSQEMIFLLKEPLFLDRRIEVLEQVDSIALYYYDAFSKGHKSLDINNQNAIGEELWLSLLDMGYMAKSKLSTDESGKGSKFRNNIFLAATTADQEHHRQNLRREFQRWGFNTYPRYFLPFSYSDMEEQVHHYLTKCTLSVHVLGNQYGLPVEGTSKSLIHAQNQIVAEHIDRQKDNPAFKGGTFRFIWINPDIQNASLDQKKYIGGLKHDLKTLRSTEIIQSPLEQFKTSLASRALAIHHEQLNPGREKTGIRLKVYLMAEDYTVPVVESIENTLASKGFDVLKLPSYNNRINLYGVHKKYLVEADGVLVYSEQNNKLWLKSKLSDILKAPGFGKKEQFKARGLVCADSMKDEALSVISDMQVMKLDGQAFSLSVLTPFLNHLRKQRL